MINQILQSIGFTIEILYYISRIKPFFLKIVVRVLFLMFLFVLELRFAVDQPLSNMICRMYGVYTVKYFQKFDKLSLNISKNEVDLLEIPNIC